MSDKAGPSEGSPLDGDAGKHGNALVEGVGTAISWLTIIPMRGARVFDRITGRRAIAALPVAGLVPGLAAVLLVWLTLTVVPLSDAGSTAIGSTAGSGAGVAGPSHPLLPLLVGVLIVCLAEWLTRGMHLDGLADVADALGSYRGPEDARKVLADPRRPGLAKSNTARSSSSRFSTGVPVRATRCSAPIARRARATAVEGFLTVCASSATTRRHGTVESSSTSRDAVP